MFGALFNDKTKFKVGCSDRIKNTYIKLVFVGTMAKREESAVDMRLCVICCNYVHEVCAGLNS